jgi:hypothetical protein
MISCGSSAIARARPPHHPAGAFRGHQLRRAAQAHRIEFHQREVVDHVFRQIGFLAHLEGDVLEYRQVGEQPALLELHAHVAAQPVERVTVELVDVLAEHLDGAARRAQLGADQP